DTRDADQCVALHAVGVHLVDAGGEHQMRTGIQQPALVLGQGPRVAVQVLVRSELQGIDEDAHDHVVGTLPRHLHQGQVSIMQIAHGRHQADTLVFLTGAAQCSTQLGNRMYRIHGQNSCSAAGNSPALTAATYALKAEGISGCPGMKLRTKRASRPVVLRPSMSCITSICPSVSGPAPMPITGMLTERVISAARLLGTHSSSSNAAPACSSAMASASSSRAWVSSRPCTL